MLLLKEANPKTTYQFEQTFEKFHMRYFEIVTCDFFEVEVTIGKRTMWMEDSDS